MLDSRILRVKKRFQMMFIGVALGLLGGIHYFLWVRLVRDPQWPTPWSGLLAWFLVLAAVGVPAVLFLSRGRTNTVAGQVVIWPAYTWLGVMFLLFTAVFAVSRMPGWTTHVLEQYQDERLLRPRAEYIGAVDRPYRPIRSRRT